MTRSTEYQKEWSGGLGLKKYVEDNPNVVSGKAVLDVAAGSGLVAKAAYSNGASSVTINDIETSALDFVGLREDLKTRQDIQIAVKTGSYLDIDPSRYDVILMADPWHDAFQYKGVMLWLAQWQPHVITSTVIRKNFSHLNDGAYWAPSRAFTELARYRLPDELCVTDGDAGEVIIYEING
jgi:predicted nicotinamide N-methyase